MDTPTPIPAPPPLDRPEEWFASGVDDLVSDGANVVVGTSGDGGEEVVVGADTKSVGWYLMLIP